MPRLALPIWVSCLAICSCDDEIRVYRVAADPEDAVPQAIRQEGARAGAVTWQAMPGWTEEKAGNFLTAAYAVPDLGRLTVSKLGGDGGGLAANVNRWRGQVGMRPLPDAEVRGMPVTVQESGREMLLFNLNPDDAPPGANGILAAILPLDSETWYFKLTGPSGKLRDRGATVFTEFLGGIRVGQQQTAPAPAMPVIHVSAPEGWEISPGGSMRAASFAVKGAAGATADVSVIPLPGNSGSVLDNVNRWRGQLQLPPLAADDDPALGSTIDGKAGTLFVTHMVSEVPLLNGKKTAISTAILRAGDITWFFKMTGDAALVEANRTKFQDFARNATLP